MSALPQSNSLYSASRRLSELEALQEIGQAANTAAGAFEGVEAIAQAALWVLGVYKVKIEDGALLAIFGPRTWPQGNNRDKGLATLVNVEANGRSWGQLRLSLGQEADPNFARFLGQQLALFLNRLDLIRERDRHRAQSKRLSERLETRKNLHRAAGLVARARSISNQQALQILVSHARKSRRTLNRIAETVLLGYEAPLARRPSLRRLQPHEFTSVARQGR